MTQLVLVLDATIVNVALPKAQIELGMSDTERQWVVTAYVLAFGSLLLLGGRLADVWGRRRSFLIGMIGFGAASVWGGLSHTSVELIAARGIQGAFAALLAPAALSMLTVIFTSGKERARAFAVFGIAAGSAATIGLALGGVLTEFVGWRWCLLVNIVFAVLGVLGAVAFMQESKADDHHGQDLWGAVLVILGFAGLTYGLTRAESGWLSVGTLSFLGLGVVLLAAFVVVESRTRSPLLPLRVLRNRTRAGAFVVQAVVGAVYIGSTMFQAFHLQAVLGFSPMTAGVASLPMALTTMALAPLATRLFERFGARYVMAAGLLVAAAGMFYLTRLTADGSYWSQMFPGLLLIGIGLAFVVVPVQNVGLSGVSWTDAGAASAVVSSSMQLGGSIALAVFTTLFVEIGGGYGSTSVEGYAAVYLAAGIVLVAGAVVSAALIRRAPDDEGYGGAVGEWTDEDAADWSRSGTQPQEPATSDR
jgi:EmrB/QacA subfamily drug resistance transporter